MIVKKVIVEQASRLHQLPPEVMSFLPDREAKRLLPKKDLIDLATFRWPVQFEEEDIQPGGYTEAKADQLTNLRSALADWYNEQYQVKLLPDREIFIGGSISSLIHTIALAFLDSGDIAFVPDLGIPLYRRMVAACGGQPVGYDVSVKHEWLPRFDRVNTRLGRVARLLYLNSPHNPTGAELSEKDMAELVWIAGRENMIVVNDAAFQSIPSRRPVSLLSVPGGKKVGVEVGSFAYHFGLPSMPLGFVVGNREIISAIAQASRILKPFMPSFAVDYSCRAINRFPDTELKTTRELITRTAVESARLLNLLSLEKSGFDTVPFVWARIERRRRSVNAANLVYRRCRVLLAPGKGFGDSGEGFLRLSLTAGPDAIASAFTRIKKRVSLLRRGEEE